VEEEINTLNNKLAISEERETAITEEMKEVKDRINKIEEEQRKVLKKRSNKNALAILLYSNEIQNNLRYYNTLDEKFTSERITQENINLTIKEKKETIKQLDNQVEQIRTQTNDIETEIDNIKTQIDDINTQIDDINTQIDNIRNEMSKITNEIDTIGNTITIKKNEIENVKNEITLIQERKARIDYTQLIKEPTSSLSAVSPKKRRNVLIAGFSGLMIFTALAFFIEYIKKQGFISNG
jgi:chromosome segregation ATPase